MTCASQKHPRPETGAVALAILRAALTGAREPGSQDPAPMIEAALDRGRGVYVSPGFGPAEVVCALPCGQVLVRMVGTERHHWTRATKSPGQVILQEAGR